MNKLIFKRHIPQVPTSGQVVIRISADSYNKVLEVATESGESLKKVVSKMVDFAYENIAYETEV